MICEILGQNEGLAEADTCERTITLTACEAEDAELEFLLKTAVLNALVGGCIEVLAGNVG